MGFQFNTSNTPQDIQRRFANPGIPTEEFLQFLGLGGDEISKSKSVSAVNFVSKQFSTAGGVDRLEFFQDRGASKFVQNSPIVRPEGEHAVIYAIQIHSQLDLDVEFTPGWVFGNNNGLLSIKSNNITYMDEYALEDLTPGQDNAGVILLNEPIVWAGQTELEAEIEFQTSIVGTGEGVMLNLFGIGLN